MTLTEKQTNVILDALTDKIENLEIWQQIHEEEIDGYKEKICELEKASEELNEMLYGKKKTNS